MAAKQLSLFDDQPTVQPLPCDPHVDERDVPRLKGQNAAILRRLQRGPATNDELIRIGRKYTSRVSDLRKAGYAITNERLEGGLTLYRLEAP